MKYLAMHFQKTDELRKTKNPNLPQVNPVGSVTNIFGYYTHRTSGLV